MAQNSTKTPFWRDVRVLRVLFQILFLLGVFLLAGILYANMLKGLDKLNLNLKLDFLWNEAGFDISKETIEYDPSDTYFKAFCVGVLNTLKVSVVGIVIATIMGLFFGIARLSSNWLVRNIAATYIEIFRNIPLLLQIVFWFGVSLMLPQVRESYIFYDSVVINKRSILLPALQRTSGFDIWVWYLVVGVILAIATTLVLAAILHHRRKQHTQETVISGYVAHISKAALWSVPSVLLIVGIIGWFLTSESPFVLDRPEFGRFNYDGGMRLSSQFTSLLIGLSVYTSAFISEIVRSGIQAVSKGQREAARAIGLSTSQTLRLIILPQAVPIIIPPLTSQYLNLTKNSSLAIAIGYPDLFRIGSTIMTQAGKSIPVFAMIMVSYLTISLTTSAAMNWYNSWINRIKR